MRKASTTAALGALLFYAPLAGAQLNETPSLSFNGFSTLGVVRSNTDQADFVADFFDPEGAGHATDLSMEVDSRLGLQLTVELSPRISNVVQIVMEQQYDDTWKPHVEWANVKYQLNPDLYIRVGRIVLPGVMASEYRKVGYALPWVRPPLEVYGLEPVSNNDGFDIGYDFRLGDFNNTLQFVSGQKDIDLPEAGEIRIRDLWGFIGSIERGSLTMHASYEHAAIDIDTPGLDSLFGAFRQFGPEGAALARRYDTDRKSVAFTGLGANYDPGDWFLMGEWGQLDSRSFIGKRRGWYLSGGYRFGPVTPYAVVGRVDVDATSSPGLSVAGLPPALAATAQGLNVGLNRILNDAPRQKTFSLGGRWDFFRDLALKVQFDYITLAPGSSGFLINEQADFRPGGSVSLYSASLDFVF